MTKNNVVQDELNILEQFKKTPEREHESCIISADRFGKRLDGTKHMTVELDEEGHHTIIAID